MVRQVEIVLCFDGTRERGCDDREEIGLGGSLGGSLGGHGIFLLQGDLCVWLSA